MCRNEMICIVLILLMSVSYAVSDHCVTYTFEQNYEEWLTNDWGRRDCSFFPFWIENKYSNIDLSAKNDQSTTFISPTSSLLSCVSSFNFNMHFNGKIEVNYYIEKDEKLWNFIDVYVRTVEGDLLGYERNEVTLPNFKSGWHTFTIPLPREGSYEGYISIMGFASTNSIVLVDSFRYIPPDMDESDCRLYEDKTTTQETITDETSTQDTSTDETSTQETSTDETSTDETSTDETRTEETSTDETSTDETSTQETSTDETSTQATSTDETSTDEMSTQETSPDETSTQGTSTQETSTDETSTDETSTDKTRTEETSTDEIRTEETGTDETSTDETTTEETGTDGTSTDETRTEETGTDRTSTSETSTTEPTTSGSTTPEPTTLAPVDMEDSKGFWAPFTFNFSFNFTTFLRT